MQNTSYYKNQHGLPFFFDEKLFEVLDNVTRLAIDIQVEVWSVERGAGDQRVDQIKALNDVLTDRRTRSSRERQNRNLIKDSNVRNDTNK